MYNKDDFFSENDELPYEEIQDLSFFIVIGGKDFIPNEMFFWKCRFWDKLLTTSFLELETNFMVDNTNSVVARVHEMEEKDEFYYVRMRGRSGYVNGKELCVFINKNLESNFRLGIDSLIEILLEYCPNFKNQKENIIHILEDDKKELVEGEERQKIKIPTFFMIKDTKQYDGITY